MLRLTGGVQAPSSIEDCVTIQEEMAALVARVAQSRDKEAFTRLFDYFGPRLNAYLARLGTDSGTAEELTQEVMVTLWRKAGQFDPSKSSVGTWLYRIARNRRIDLLRRDKSDTLDQEEPALQPSALPDLDGLLDAQLMEDKIRAAITRLPAEQLSLVRLAFFEGLSHSQISERTGLPLGTVKSRIRLAFTRLRRELEDEGVESAV